MSDETDPESRDQEASEKKISDAIERGNTPIAHDLSLLGSVCGVYAALVAIRHFVSNAHVATLGVLLDRSWDIRIIAGADAMGVLQTIILALSAPWFAILAACFLISLVLGGATQRPRVVWKRLKVDGARLNPVKGVGRIFGKKGWAAFFKLMLKNCLAFAAAGFAFGKAWVEITDGASREPAAIGAVALAAMENVTLSVAGVLACFAIFDLVMSRLSWRKELRMTRQEVKDEIKQAEGDPMVKMRLRSLALDRARRRMLTEVSSATMVVANPTHYAVALRYVREEGGAPVVVAKGQELIALKIRGEAERREIPVVEQPELARALYRAVEVGQLIPPEFYKAVAEIVNFLSKRDAATPPPR
ncbi:MAG: flagellar biosynthesis protein FlhB [Rhodoblastus sp.]